MSEYDVRAIMDALKEKEEMDPDKHDGCYELMRETIGAYSKLRDFSVIDFRDLNLVYLTTVGTWKQGLDSKKKTVDDSHLSAYDKARLNKLWDEIWRKAGRGDYKNELSGSEGASIGLFGTGFFSFQRTTTNAHAKAFIKMCVDILPMTDDDRMFDRAAVVLKSSFQGMQAGAASMILHCLKPYNFPVLNTNMGRGNVFEILGVNLVRRGDIGTYIDNCRRIKAFRNKNFTFKNYRIFDITAWTMDEFRLQHEHGKYGYWEILSETVARLDCGSGELVLDQTQIPKDISWFFRIGDLFTKAKREVVLVHDGYEFDGYFQRESVSPIRIKLYWDKSFSEEFASSASGGNEVKLDFTRLENDRFDVKLANPVHNEENKGGKVWLLTWNKNNWYWKKYAEICEATKNGETYEDSWACASSKPQIGEEVYLIKVGDQPRGIIGHGTVSRPAYETSHYDAVKAAEGKKEKAIGVRFDRILDYEKEKFISQDELNDKCQGQHWSPQGSGIEIKQEVIPTLHNLWEAVTRKQDLFGFKEMVSFLEDYSGKHYAAPVRAGNQSEYMSEMKDRGQDARQRFAAFGRALTRQFPELELASCSNWINQGQVVQRYLWIELKNEKWKDYPQSVSLSIEKHNEVQLGEGWFLSVRAEMRNESSDSPEYKRQLRLLDRELPEGMYYLARHRDETYHNYGSNKGLVRRLCDNGTILKLEIVKAIEDLEKKDAAGTVFSEAVKAIDEIKPLYEYVMSEDEPEDNWWPSLSEYDPGLTALQYHSYFIDDNVVKKPWLEAIYELYQMPDHYGSCKQLSARFGHQYTHYISYFSSAGARIMKEAGVSSPQDDKNSKYWPVLFQGKNSNIGYLYKLREPVQQAIEMLIEEGFFDAKEHDTMAKFDHNMILYGPPGTGKTYHSVIYAVAICDGKSIEKVEKEPYKDVLLRYNELRDDGRIAFTTFHQSYGYEEFIEGIKPKLDTDSDTIGYRIEDGVFKEFCKRAWNIRVQAPGIAKIKAIPKIWGMILGGSGKTDLKKYCFENNEIRLGWSEVDDEDVEGDFFGDDKVSWQGKHMVSDFKNAMEVGDLVVIEKNNTCIDAIGVITGEYDYDESDGEYPRSRSVEWLVKDIDQDMLPYLPNGRKQLSRFSLFAFDYIGIDTITEILNEHMGESIMKAKRDTKPYVFIIDEINRGNISKIFGELITLIEDTKRAGAEEAMEAILPYSGEAFSVPSNVYILGTMNTADRSIALMDTALRRRFKFAEMMPNSEVLESLGVGTIAVGDQELNVAKMLDVINQRIEYLFDREHTIGHAFFTKLADDPSLEMLAGIFEKNVIPLLQEYFYEDYEKIQLVLGDNSKEDEYKFILDQPIKEKDIFNGNPGLDLPEKRYTIQHDAFLKLESYKKISKDL